MVQVNPKLFSIESWERFCAKGRDGQGGGTMARDLEQEIRNLQKELEGIQKDRDVLRLQPCRGDAEIRAKDAKYEDLARRAAILRETIRDLTRKRQLLIFESNSGG
jgi:chromosome segregation ATPase